MGPVSQERSIDSFHDKVERNISRGVDKDGRSYSIFKGGDSIDKLWSEFLDLLENHSEPLSHDKWLKTFSLLQSLEGKTHVEKEAQAVSALSGNVLSSKPKAMLPEIGSSIETENPDSLQQTQEMLYKYIDQSKLGPKLSFCFSELFDSLDTKEVKDNLASSIFDEIKNLNLSLEKKKELFELLHALTIEIESVIPKDRFLENLSKEIHLLTTKFLPDFVRYRHDDRQLNDFLSTNNLNDFIQNCTVTFSQDTSFLQKEGHKVPLDKVIENFNRIVNEKTQSGNLTLDELDTSLGVYLELQQYLQEASSKRPPTKTPYQPIMEKELQESLSKLEKYTSSSTNPEVQKQWKSFNELRNTHERLLHGSLAKVLEKESTKGSSLIALTLDEITTTERATESLFSTNNSLDNFLNQVETFDVESTPGKEPLIILKNGCKQPLTSVLEYLERCQDAISKEISTKSLRSTAQALSPLQRTTLYTCMEKLCKNLDESTLSLPETDKTETTKLAPSEKPLKELKMTLAAKIANALFMSQDLQKCFSDKSRPDVLEISLNLFGEHYIAQTKDPSGKIIKIFNEATEPLSKGGYKAGFLATDPETGEELFRLHPLAGGSPEEMIKERDMSKTFLAANVPGIPKIELVKTLNGKNPGELGLMMDFYQNGDLENYLHEHPDLPVQTRISLALDITTTMQGIHGEEYTHLDEKSKNVLVGYVDGQLKAYTIDFGFCKKHTKDATINPRYTGTSGYGAREMLTQEKEIPLSKDLDTWSVGMTMFDLFEPNLPKKGNYFIEYNGQLQQLYRTASDYTSAGNQLPDRAGNQTPNLHSLFDNIRKSFPQPEWDSSFKELDALFLDYTNHLKNFVDAQKNTDSKALANEREYLEKTCTNIQEKLKDLLDKCEENHFISHDVLASAWGEVSSKGADGKADPKTVEKGIQKIHLSARSEKLQRSLNELKKLNIITDAMYENGIYTDPETHRSVDLRTLDPASYKGELEPIIKSTWEKLIEKKRNDLEAESSPSSKSSDKDVKAFLSKLLDLTPEKKLTLPQIHEELTKLQTGRFQAAQAS